MLNRNPSGDGRIIRRAIPTNSLFNPPLSSTNRIFDFITCRSYGKTEVWSVSNNPSAIKLRFDIHPNSSDIDIANYEKRTDDALDHLRSTRVILPMDCIGNMQQSIKRLEQDNTEQDVQIKQHEVQIRALEQVNEH